jgi:hypothetical protein
MISLAHHVAAHHLPILAAVFTVGGWAGWQLASVVPMPRLLRKA